MGHACTILEDVSLVSEGAALGRRSPETGDVAQFIEARTIEEASGQHGKAEIVGARIHVP